jgi:ubiquitin C-terminal hydrolase
LIKEEIESFNFNKKNYSNEEIMQCIESSAKNDKNKQYQSIKDCFELFFEKELLEDPLSCRVCGGPQYFFKNYEINRLPYVLILSLKRFKYNENNNFKLKQLITYPIFDFELKDKKYDLFGVINHYGGINSGHYTCYIKHNNKWIACDDRRVYEIEQDRVMNSNAYILFYISKESINLYSFLSLSITICCINDLKLL